MFSVFIVIIIAIVLFSKISELSDRVKRLESIVSNSEFTPVKQEQEPVKNDNFQENIEERPIEESYTEVQEEKTLEEPQNMPHIPSMLEKELASRANNKESFEIINAKNNLESFIAGNLLNRIGVVALIIGVGFFLKYAFDNNWINEVTQILIGFLVGGGLLYGAHHFKKDEKFQILSQGLAGAGISVLYLTIFAAYNFYHLIPYGFSFVLMSGVTILAFFQAMQYDSMAVAILGLVGGFITPFILNTGENNLTGLFTYLFFLNIWIIALIYKKNEWKAVEITSILTTYILFFASQGHHNSNTAITILFLTAIWGLYLGLDISRIPRQLDDAGKSKYFINAFNALFFYLGLKSTISYAFDSKTAIVITTLLIGALYLTIALITRKKYPETKNIYKQWILTAAILLIFATNTFFTGLGKIIAWTIEAFAFVYIGSKYEHNYIWKFALWFYGFIVFMLLCTKGAIDYTPIDSFIPVWNLRTLTFITLALSIIGSGLLLDKDSKKGIKPVFDYTWTIIIFILLTSEINDYFRQQTNLAGGDTQQLISFHQNILYSFVWALYSIPLIRFGLKKETSAFKFCGFGILIFALLQILVIGSNYTPIENFIFFFNFRMIAFITLIAALLLVIKWLKEANASNTFIKTIQIILSLLVLYLLTIESSDIFNKQLYIQNSTYALSQDYQQIELLRNLKQLSLSGVWLIYSIILMIWGILRKIKIIRIVSLFILGLCIFKIFLFDLSFLSQLYRIVSFIGLGVILLFASYLYQRFSSVILNSEDNQNLN